MDNYPKGLAVPVSIWVARPELMDRLMELHTAGSTLSQIAETLNAEFGTGFSRSAISGRLHRSGIRKGAVLEIGQRAEAGLQREKEMKEPAKTPVEEKPPVVPERGQYEAAKPVRIRREKLPPLEGGLGLDLLQLNVSTCKWPFGDLPPFTFCGYPVVSEKVYCHDHCEVAYNAARPRR
jgi:GcrA cell cycle regulator